MKRALGIVTVGVATVIGGCSSGEDVYIETNTTRSELCTLSREDDVCARTWTNVPAAKRADVVTWLDAVVMFARETRTMLDELDAACTEMAGNLAIALPAVAESRTTSTTARCNVVGDTIRLRKAGPFTVKTTMPSSCTTLPAPSCVLPGGPPGRECTLPQVTLEPTAPPTDADRELAAAIQGGFAHVIQTSKGADRLVTLTEPFVKTPMQNESFAVPECLLATAMSLVTQASSEARAAFEITAELQNAIDSP